MRRVLAVSLCLITLIGLSSPVLTQDEPYYPYGGGIVYGQILGFNWFNELIPVVWADVSAWQDGELVAKAYSTSGGYYEIILSVGWYTITIEEPGYQTQSREIFVSSASSTAINFVLKLSMEPIHKPKPKPPPNYTVKISVSGLPSNLKTQLYIDNVVKAELSDGETIKLEFEVGTSHEISVNELIEKDGERYIIDSPSIEVFTGTFHIFSYNAEYLLEFSTEPEGLSLPSIPQVGWYSEGKMIITPTAPALIEESPVIRYQFKAWRLDNYELDGNPIEFKMDSHHILKAVYTKEYLVELSSTNGAPMGSGWYPAGSSATISIQRSEGLLIRHVFVGWSGDYIGKESTATFKVDKPMNIVAIWTTDYTPLITLIALISAAIASAAVIIKYKKPKSSR